MRIQSRNYKVDLCSTDATNNNNCADYTYLWLVSGSETNEGGFLHGLAAAHRHRDPCMAKLVLPDIVVASCETLEHVLPSTPNSLFQPHAWNCVRFCFGAVCYFFVCVWNISGIAERICTTFTDNTCLVPPSDEFEGQGQGPKVKVIRDKKRHFSALLAACVRFRFGKTSLASSFSYSFRAALSLTATLCGCLSKRICILLLQQLR